VDSLKQCFVVVDFRVIFNIYLLNVEIFLQNIPGKSVIRTDFPAILPRREAIFLLYLAGKSVLQTDFLPHIL